MSDVGQKEKLTQERVVKLFRDTLKYEYLGDWADREDNSNIEVERLNAWLKRRGYSDVLIERALRELAQAAGDRSKSLYDRNKAVHGLLRYGVKVRPEVGENKQDVWLIDWEEPLNNDFAIAEEVTVPAANIKARGKRPDIVLYVNGIALGLLELKRSTVSVAEGIRQNLDSQKREFIQPFFSTVQFIMAGNDTEGLRYGVIETPEKYFLTWKESSPIENQLDRALTQLCSKVRILELIHDFLVYDAGTKKICRHNQYFGVRAAQEYVKRREGGIIWHTQGSGKSLTMVWLAKWILEHYPAARVLVITDRTELDEQTEKVYSGVHETIYRTKSGADLVSRLNAIEPRLMCSLVHKFGGKDEADVEGYLAEMKAAIPRDFQAKGEFFVFVDECHRTHAHDGKLHTAMKTLLPNAVFFGFTGTPLLKKDKKKSVEVFGPYIHKYKWDEAVRDKVVVDLRYEARDIDQKLTSQDKVDQWFEAKTRGLTDLAKAQLKSRWGTMKRVLSSQSRLEKIVADILMDMSTKPRLMDGYGNALLVSGSIYSACKFYELFQQTDLKGKCAIVTSYRPSPSDIKGEESGEGTTEKLRQYEIYCKMLADWFNEPVETAINKVEQFEKDVKKKFIEEPGQIKLLIVVDKLLTGFDAPSATYLYIDKQMQDHGLFQAICRVNRLDGEDKEYGFIVDYKDLFKSLEKAVKDYTSEAFDAYDKEDVDGLLKDRLASARQRLDDAREAVKALCEPVEQPRNLLDLEHFFCAVDSGDASQLKDNEQKRLNLYKLTAALIRAYANIANELAEAGYSEKEIAEIRAELDHYAKVRDGIKLSSGDYIDLKMYEPAMRHLIDNYIRAEDSRKISAFDDLSLIELLVERGPAAVNALPKDLQNDKEAVAETIENNVRRLIIDESPVNPKYYEKMSLLLDALIAQRKKEAISYAQYLAEIAALAKKVKDPRQGASYPSTLDSPAKRALYDNLERDEALALAIDQAVRKTRKDGFRENPFKLKEVKFAIRALLRDKESLVDEVVKLIVNQSEY